MLNTININLKTDIKTDRPTTLPITLMSQDKNNNQFILRFTNGGESVTLDDNYTVEVLTKFSKSGTSRLTTAKVRQDYATWEFDTAYVTQDETVYNYVYVRKSGSLVVSADANCFVFSVDLSEIDKGAGKVAETYDEIYQRYLDEFKDNVDFEEIAQAEQARKEAETLREESYEQKVDLAIVEADVVEKVDNKVTELTPKINDLTAQLAQKANQTDLEKTNRKVKPLVYGELKMPDDFTPTLPCKFYRDNDGVIRHNMDFNKYKKGTVIYVTKMGNDTHGDGSKEIPYRTLTKAVEVAIAGTDTEYKIITNVPMFNRDEGVFNQTVTGKTISIISEGVLEERARELNESKQYLVPAELEGTWLTSGSHYAYTTTIGDGFTVEFEGSEVIFQHRADDLGGMFEFIVDGNVSNKKQISTYHYTNYIKKQTLFTGLAEGKHTLQATFLGEDPDNPVASPRGWIMSNPSREDYWTLRSSVADYSTLPSDTPDKTMITSNDVYTWVADGAGTYKTNRSSVSNVIDVTNLDIYGVPIPMQKVETLAECQAQKNTWYKDASNDVWVHRTDETQPTVDSTVLNISVNGVDPTLGENGILYFENLIFTGWTFHNSIRVKSVGSIPFGEVCFNKCLNVGSKERMGLGNGLSVENVKNVYSFDCISAYNQLDGFNYHYESIAIEEQRNCFALEYNCKAYESGTAFIGSNGSNNSSAHEGINILRIGTVGYKSTGASVIDVTGCYSVLFDCNIRTPIDANTLEEGIGRTFVFSSDGTGVGKGKTYMVNCGATDCTDALTIGSTHTAEVNNFRHDGEIVVNGTLNYF